MTKLRKAHYRFMQFWHHVTAPELSPAARQQVADVLSAEELSLFAAFSRGDQWHGFRVMRTLCDAGYQDPDLMVAALLHDVGKTQLRFTPVERSAEALIRKLMPKLAARWETGEPAGWRRPFVARARHPEWSARMASAAGSRPRAINLMRRHQDQLPTIETYEDELLSYLQWADDQN